MVLFLVMLALCFVGLLSLYAASAPVSMNERGHPDYYFLRQSVFFVMGLVGMFLFSQIQLKSLQKLTLPGLIGTIFLLVLVFVPGIGDSVSSKTESFHRWISLGPIRFQPSEFAKIAIVLYAADFLSRQKPWETPVEFKRLILPFGLILATLLAVVLQPQYGTTICILAALLGILFLAGFPMLRVMYAGFAASPILFLIAVVSDYRLERLKVWLDPGSFRNTGGYQLIKSFRAFRDGGWTGEELSTGFAHRYLTYGHTDFILSLFAENFGYIGLLVLFGLFAFLVLRSAQLLKNVPMGFNYLAGAGSLSMLCAQTVVNIFVVTGLSPTTGVSLPFMSYGGSSLVTVMCFCGIILNSTSYSNLNIPSTLFRRPDSFQERESHETNIQNQSLNGSTLDH